MPPLRRYVYEESPSPSNAPSRPQSSRNWLSSSLPILSSGYSCQYHVVRSSQVWNGDSALICGGRKQSPTWSLLWCIDHSIKHPFCLQLSQTSSVAGLGHFAAATKTSSGFDATTNESASGAPSSLRLTEAAPSLEHLEVAVSHSVMYSSIHRGDGMGR